MLATEPPPKRVGVLVAIGGRGAVHAAALSAEADRARRLAGRGVPAGGARRLRRLGRVAGDRHGRAQCGGVQLLSPAADRSVHDLELRELGRPDRVPHRRGAGQLYRRGDARAHARGRGAPARGRSRRGDGAAAAAREQPRAGAADRRGPARAGAGAALGRDRDGGARRRRAPGRVPAARRHSPAGDAAGRGRHARGEPAPAAGARGAGAGGAAERGAGARGAARRGGRDGVAAPRRRGQDGGAARGLPRSALAVDRYLRGRRGGRPAGPVRARARGAGVGDRAGDAPAVAVGGEPARPVAPGGRAWPNRTASGPRSRRCSAPPWRSSPARTRISRSRSIASCRSCARTRRSWSARS